MKRTTRPQKKQTTSRKAKVVRQRQLSKVTGGNAQSTGPGHHGGGHGKP